jgi:putative endonuclease
MSNPFYIYILASGKHGTLYLGVTNDIVRRTYEHRSKAVRGFAERYNVHKLVYFEIFDDPVSAIAREKQTVEEVEPRMETSTHRKQKPRLG